MKIDRHVSKTGTVTYHSSEGLHRRPDGGPSWIGPLGHMSWYIYGNLYYTIDNLGVVIIDWTQVRHIQNEFLREKLDSDIPEV